MNLPKVHSKIFWPSHCGEKGSGYIIGWNIRSFIICVLTVVEGVEYAELERILNKFASNNNYNNYYQDNSNTTSPSNSTNLHSFDAGNKNPNNINFNHDLNSHNHTTNHDHPNHSTNQSKTNAPNTTNRNLNPKNSSNTTTVHHLGAPKILGLWIANQDGPTIRDPWNMQVPDVHDVDIWVTLEQDRYKYPQIREICCYGYRYQKDSRWTSAQIIFYTPPKDYFYSMHQLVFNASSDAYTCDCSSPATELEATLRQINCSREIEHIISSMMETEYDVDDAQLERNGHVTSTDNNQAHSNTGLRRRTRPNSTTQQRDEGERTIPLRDSAGGPHKMYESFAARLLAWIVSPASLAAWLSVLFMKILCTLMLYMLTKMRLHHRTYTGLQLYYRLSVLQEFSCESGHSTIPVLEKIFKLCHLETTIASLLARSPTSKSSPSHFTTKHTSTSPNSTPPLATPHLHSPYNICTWPSLLWRRNSYWLGVNDILLGVVVGYILFSNGNRVLEILEERQKQVTSNVLISLIEWLMGWPAGFKLNENLDRFLGRLFLYYIDKWSKVTYTIFFYIGTYVILGVSFSGVLGVSVIISIILDLASFFTVHITCFYYISARFHHLELVVLSSLWKLFRGMKYNPLKHRIDSSDYAFDQLLLGTILLTLLVFLFPTTAVYYVFFTSLRLVLICFQGLGGLALELLNYFPLYHLFVYFMHPELMPAGIRFAVENKRTPALSPSGREILPNKEHNNQTQDTNSELDEGNIILNTKHKIHKTPLASSADSFPALIAKKSKTKRTKHNLAMPIVDEEASQPTTYLRLESQPVLGSSLFFHLHHFISDVLKTYTFPKVMKSFVTGGSLN